MSIIEEVVVKTRAAFGAAGKKTGEIVELKKLQISAIEINNEIKKKFEALGKNVYDAKKTDSDTEELVRQNITTIDQLYARLALTKEKIYLLKNIVKCSNCSAANVNTAIYCNKCGSKLVTEPAEPPVSD